MNLWRKNKKVEKELAPFLKVGLSRFNNQLISIANFLQRKTNSYSVRKKKILLLLFLVVFVTESVVVTIQSITGKKKTIVDVSRIKTISIESKGDNEPHLSKDEFLKIQRFKNYIDSLNTTPRGEKIKDSLLHNRPRLMDSVNYLINLYLKQSKTLMK